MRHPLVEQATKVWLQLNGFPAGDGTLGPADFPLEEKPLWKGGYIHAQYPELVGLIEDHPKVVESLPPDYQGTIFLYSHDSSPRDDLRVIPCPTWHDVEVAVQRELPRMLGLSREV